MWKPHHCIYSCEIKMSFPLFYSNVFSLPIFVKGLMKSRVMQNGGSKVIAQKGKQPITSMPNLCYELVWLLKARGNQREASWIPSVINFPKEGQGTRPVAFEKSFLFWLGGCNVKWWREVYLLSSCSLFWYEADHMHIIELSVSAPIQGRGIASGFARMKQTKHNLSSNLWRVCLVGSVGDHVILSIGHKQVLFL